MITWWIAFRYLKAKRKQRFISLITWISILGIVVGVMALITVIAVMSGFDKSLTEKIVGISPHIIVEKEGGIDNYTSVIKKMREKPAIKAVSPLVEGPVLITSQYATLAIVLRGINPKEEVNVSDIGKHIRPGELNFEDSKDKIILGEELARRLGIEIGDKVIIVPSSGKVKGGADRKTFRVGALFKCGMYEYDANLAYISLERAQELFFIGSNVHGLGVRVNDYYQANKIAEVLRELLGPSYGVRSWIEARSNLFTALRMEKTVMFVVVALIIVVATFNIASTLIMIVMEKTKDIAILKTIGASSGKVMAIFICIGSFLGMIGTGIGIVAGIRLANSLDSILNFLNKTFGIELFSPKIYYLDRLPVFINPRDVATITICALVLSVIATFYPAWQASRLNPVEALRYE